VQFAWLKGMKSDLVRLMNEAYARLQLKPERIEELPIELGQLQQAMETANPRVDFDIDPHDFRAALLEVAAGKCP
jgi:hypothetical protein